MPAHPIHHVTAVTANVATNLRFYVETLGLRLVKRTVNQDAVSAYHLFYADGAGTPGTDLTFFDWPNAGANISGATQVVLTTFRVPTASLGFWEERLGKAEAKPVRQESSLLFADPEGQRLEFLGVDEFPNEIQPWSAVVSEDHAIRGILGVDLASAHPEATREVLETLLGYESQGNAFFATREGVDARLRIVEAPEGRIGRVGAGGVHHVAFRVEDDAELYAMQSRIEAAGHRTSGLIDRFWFHSLYFREPGGILFELATEGPGFGADEAMDQLGESLVLPPFLEPQRARIVANLKPLPI